MRVLIEACFVACCLKEWLGLNPTDWSALQSLKWCQKWWKHQHHPNHTSCSCENCFRFHLPAGWKIHLFHLAASRKPMSNGDGRLIGYLLERNLWNGTVQPKSIKLSKVNDSSLNLIQPPNSKAVKRTGWCRCQTWKWLGKKNPIPLQYCYMNKDS